MKPKSFTRGEIDWRGRDVMAAVQSVIRRSYLDRMDDMKVYAMEVKFYNSRKRKRKMRLVLWAVREDDDDR